MAHKITPAIAQYLPVQQLKGLPRIWSRIKDFFVMMEDNTKCDVCDRRATMKLTEHYSKWCANWFEGRYCRKCHELVEMEMYTQCLPYEGQND